MLLAYFDRAIGLRELRMQHPSPDAGRNLAKLMQIARCHNLAPRAVRLEVNELANLQLPCILHWDYNHYVVLERVARRGCQIINPALGRRRYSIAEVSRHFTPASPWNCNQASTFSARRLRPG